MIFKMFELVSMELSREIDHVGLLSLLLIPRERS